jgi:AcrR family transcriptional regulator
MLKQQINKEKNGSKPVGRPRSQNTHRAILDALRELLTERPLTSISIEAIAKRAGAGKKTIYRWWADKASLYADLYDTDSPNSINVPDMGSLDKELTEASMQIWHFWRGTASGQGYRQLLASCQSNAQCLNELRDVFMPRRRKVVQDILDRAIARGEIDKKDCNVLIDMVMGFNMYHLITNSLDDDSVIPIMISNLVNGCKASSGKRTLRKRRQVAIK